MQIQKGLVKYKDRSDIVCTYGVAEDGKQYYFLDNTSMTNGNIIASTVLVEAIDPVVASSSVGVISSEGNVIIPFVNKSIKPVVDGVLLVEVANSTTPSVVEANGLKSDPLSATKLVTTSAAIKDKINVKMGSEGRFIFNDQFSEATICDYDGNNLLDNQYFSFIAIKNNDMLYLCKNTVESSVLEYSLSSRQFIIQNEGTVLDVQNTDITQKTIDGVMAAEESSNGFSEGDITEKDFESVADSVPVEPAVVEPDEVSSLESETESDEETDNSDNTEEPESVIPEAISQEDLEKAFVGESLVNAETTEEVVDISSTDNINEQVSSFEETENVVEEDLSGIDLEKQEFSDAIENDENSISGESDGVISNNEEQLMEFNFKDDNNYLDNISKNEVDEIETPVDDVVSEFKSDLFDVNLNSDIFSDSILQVDKIDVNSGYSDFNYKVPGSRDTIIEDVASTMSNLIRQNKNQKQTILAYEEKLEQVSVAYKKVVDKARSQLRDVEVLKNKVKNYETIVAKLEAKLDILESKVRDQDKVIMNQTKELESLRPQIEGKEELVRILADAQNLLDQSV